MSTRTPAGHTSVPRVVAIGGGHGTAVTLRAARCYASHLTAVVSVADDGGSTGRLRQELGVVALGDMRKCLVALAEPSSVLARAFEHRFDTSARPGELAGHALGNLVLAGLIEATGGLVAGIDAAAELLGAAGRVLPATTEKVTLKAMSDRGEVNGQVAVAATASIRRVSLVPEGASPPPEALSALADADQVVIGPGSLYTSVLAAAAVRGIGDALASSSAQKVYVCNLRPQTPETAGYDVAAHVAALREHGVEVDLVLWDSNAGLALGSLDLPVLDVPLAGPNGLVHDPARLANALAGLLS
ncbi:MAG: YvcK family protein [Actinomycetota bacterium]|nr:YvcK family protein [Actinomycetota bacterium]